MASALPILVIQPGELVIRGVSFILLKLCKKSFEK
jgi:hypothetical protein